ncbi:hypothetical protein AgCh_018640 [Apium graveolens]
MERRPEPNNLHPKETEEKIGSKVQQLTSWKYWDDPPPGNFSVGIDPDISAQAVERIGQSVLKDERMPSDLIILSCEEDYADFVPFLGKIKIVAISFFHLQMFLNKKNRPVTEMQHQLHLDIKDPLKKLCNDLRTTVVVISGSERSVLDKIFGEYNMWLAAEHALLEF